MRTLWLCVLAACTPAAPQASTLPAEPRMVAPPAAPPPPTLDEATLKAKSHAFVEATDRMDLAAFTAELGPTFVMFREARFLDGPFLAKGIQNRLDRHAPIRSRTWGDEHVYIGGTAAVFIGESVEHVPADADRPAVEFDGYNTLVWVYDGDRWKVAHWQWARAGLEAEKQSWNDTFKASLGFNHKPNQLLVDTVKGRKPGVALDLLMGQGRNALYLAAQGWKVTGVDISDEGLKLARETAAKQKLKLDAIEADIDKWDLGTDRWDLITMIYAGNDHKLVDKAKAGLKKGGLFVLEYFHKDSEAAKAGAGGWATGELAALFGNGFKILRDDVVEDTADWSLRKLKLVRFVAEKQ